MAVVSPLAAARQPCRTRAPGTRVLALESGVTTAILNRLFISSFSTSPARTWRRPSNHLSPATMPLLPRDHRIEGGETPSALRAVARWARSASDGMLVACAIIGLTGSAMVVVFWPAFWPLALPGLTLAGFGVWGVTDRMVSELSGVADSPESIIRALHFLRLASGVVAVAALLGFLLSASTLSVFTVGSGWF